MHFLFVVLLHGLIYGVIFHLLRHLSGPELLAFGAGAVLLLVVTRFRRPWGRRRYDRRW